MSTPQDERVHKRILIFCASHVSVKTQKFVTECAALLFAPLSSLRRRRLQSLGAIPRHRENQLLLGQTQFYGLSGPKDLFDARCRRTSLIAGTAIRLDAPLITGDERIRASGLVRTIW
jgi:hypothetical protein